MFAHFNYNITCRLYVYGVFVFLFLCFCRNCLRKCTAAPLQTAWGAHACDTTGSAALLLVFSTAVLNSFVSLVLNVYFLKFCSLIGVKDTCEWHKCVYECVPQDFNGLRVWYVELIIRWECVLCKLCFYVLFWIIVLFFFVFICKHVFLIHTLFNFVWSCAL